MDMLHNCRYFDCSLIRFLLFLIQLESSLICKHILYESYLIVRCTSEGWRRGGKEEPNLPDNPQISLSALLQNTELKTYTQSLPLYPQNLLTCASPPRSLIDLHANRAENLLIRDNYFHGGKHHLIDQYPNRFRNEPVRTIFYAQAYLILWPCLMFEIMQSILRLQENPRHFQRYIN